MMLVLALLRLSFPLVTQSQNSVTNVENPLIGRLVQQLKSKSIQARLDATYALSRIDPPVAVVAVPTLIQALEDKDGLVRAASAYTLSQVGTAQAKSAVLRILPQFINTLVNHSSDDSYLRVRAATIVAVGAMGAVAQNVTPILIQALKDDREEIRANSAVALGRIGQPVEMVVPALIQFMQGDDLAQATGAYALSQIKSLEAEAAVLEILPKLIYTRNSNDPKVTTATLVALKGIGPPACLALLEEMSQTDPTLRKKAVQTLEQIGETAISVLVQTLSSKDQKLRLSATLALGQIGASAEVAVPNLIELLDDPDQLICGLSAYALGGLVKQRKMRYPG